MKNSQITNNKPQDFLILEKKLGVCFQNKKILEQALVHRSYLNEQKKPGLKQNERLEFLGDAVLELIVTNHLYHHYSNSEGDLTAWRSALVNTKTLAKIAENFSLENFIFLSRGERKDIQNDYKSKQSLLADTFEAILGAIYIDQGYETAKQFIEKHLIPSLDGIIKSGTYKDPKSLFQEKSQEKFSITPTYNILDEWGPDHAKNFRVGVYLDDRLVAEGEGLSKKEAQEKAAQKALEKEFSEIIPPPTI